MGCCANTSVSPPQDMDYCVPNGEINTNFGKNFVLPGNKTIKTNVIHRTTKD